ncbi:hypothetical protein EE612_011568, partial [Oryza sativa]
MDPAERSGGGGRRPLRRLLRPLLHPPEPRPEAADEVLRAPPFAGEPRSEAGDAPPRDEELDDPGVVGGGVHAEALRDGGEAGEEAVVGAVVHEARRHGDLAAHHAGEGPDRVVRVHLEELGDDGGVGGLVALLVGGDGAADAGQGGVAVAPRVARRVAVGDGGGALLERRVDEPHVRVGANAYHAGANEVLYRLLDLPHVDPAGEVEVLVHQVAVPVLLGGPRPGPHGPGAAAGAGLVAHPAVHGVEHRLVRGERLLGDHVADEAHQVVVGEPRRALPQRRHLVAERRRARVREVVLRLPRLLHGLEVGEDGVRRPPLQGVEDLLLLRR